MTVLCRATFLLIKVGKVKKKKKQVFIYMGLARQKQSCMLTKKVGYIGKNVMQHDVGKLFLW